MIPDQRREEILRLLREQPVLSVRDLISRLDVSHMTVRRDIETLEREGRAYSVPGGVRLASHLRTEPSYVDKSVTDLPQKRGMAAVAADLVEDDMTIYLDAGTTMLSMVPLITNRSGLTVVTNDFSTLDALAGNEGIAVFHTGGRLEHQNLSAVGRLAAMTLRQVNIDRAFISASSWDVKRGVTTPTEAKVEVKRAAIEVSASTVLVAGSNKYGTFATHQVAALREFDHVITDQELPSAAAAGIRDRGVALTLASLAAGGDRAEG